MQHRGQKGFQNVVTVKPGVLRGCKATGRGGDATEVTLKSKVSVVLGTMKVCK